MPKRVKIVVLDEAWEDLRKAKDYYLEIDIDLADNFVYSFDKIIGLIELFPQIERVRNNGIYRTNMRNFPYFVSYIYDKKQRRVVILSVLHAKRNPKILRQEVIKRRFSDWFFMKELNNPKRRDL